MALTYDKIATQTLGSAAASITFSSIAASWTDLRIVLVPIASVGGLNVTFQYNADTATNYSWTNLFANGATVGSNGSNSVTSINWSAQYNLSTTIPTAMLLDIFSYAGATNKTSLSSNAADLNGSGGVEMLCGLWRSTAAITSVKLNCANFATGTIATLYGIKNA
jgi:hypothetical protein